MNKLPLLFLAVLCPLLTGCPHDEYVVELTPSGDALERTLTCWREYGPTANTTNVVYHDFPVTNVTSLGKIYADHQYAPANKHHTFRGRFVAAMPADVGGAGSFTRFTTSLGTVSVYSERFRGDDDLMGRLESGNRAADQLVDLVRGWLQTELRKEPGFGQLRKFVDVQLRRDVKNVILYVWQARLAPDCQKNVEETCAFRIGQYLVERGYFKPSELPLVMQFWSGDSKAGRELPFLQRFVARQMGVPDTQPVPRSLNFLGSAAAGEQSWTNYVKTTALYRDRLKRWERERKANPKLEPLTVDDVIGELIEPIFDFKFFATSDHLAVKLSLPVKPESTNGQWDPETGRIAWGAWLNEDKPEGLPTVCYALWNQPNEAFQNEHFGKVALNGEPLTDYVMSCAALEKGRSQEWEAFLASLKPGPDLMAKISAFRFADEAAKPVEPGANDTTGLAGKLVKSLKSEVKTPSLAP